MFSKFTIDFNRGVLNHPCGSIRSLSVVCVAIITSGCQTPMVGPVYRPPLTNVHAEWSNSSHVVLAGQPADLAEWWSAFDDPYLNFIIQGLVQQNPTLREAGHRIAESRARLGVVRGNLFPQKQTVGGTYAKSRISNNTANFFEAPGVFVPELSIENWQVGLNSAWELDFWGRYRRAIEAASAELEATVAQYDDARVLLIAEAARAYVAMRAAERRHSLALQNVELLYGTFQLVQSKNEEGAASPIDLAQAESNLRETESLVPVFEVKRRLASHRLCILLGQPPCDLASVYPSNGSVPRVAEGIAVGIPCDLLRQRPDVRRAERELAAQSARIGVAEADFYPQVGLNGSIGLEAEDLGKLFSTSSGVGVIAPYFKWNILNYGRITWNVKAETEAFHRLTESYRVEVLDALREAEDAQVSLVNGNQRVAALTASANAADEAASLAEAAYQEGATDFSRVYLLQSDLVQRQDRLAAAEAELAASAIDLFEALGGGWQITSPACEQPASRDLAPQLAQKPVACRDGLFLPPRMPRPTTLGPGESQPGVPIALNGLSNSKVMR